MSKRRRTEGTSSTSSTRRAPCSLGTKIGAAVVIDMTKFLTLTDLARSVAGVSRDMRAAVAARRQKWHDDLFGDRVRRETHTEILQRLQAFDTRLVRFVNVHFPLPWLADLTRVPALIVTRANAREVRSLLRTTRLDDNRLVMVPNDYFFPAGKHHEDSLGDTKNSSSSNSSNSSNNNKDVQDDEGDSGDENDELPPGIEFISAPPEVDTDTKGFPLVPLTKGLSVVCECFECLDTVSPPVQKNWGEVSNLMMWLPVEKQETQLYVSPEGADDQLRRAIADRNCLVDTATLLSLLKSIKNLSVSDCDTGDTMWNRRVRNEAAFKTAEFARIRCESLMCYVGNAADAVEKKLLETKVAALTSGESCFGRADGGRGNVCVCIEISPEATFLSLRSDDRLRGIH
jgi:hypothetical protein